MLNAYPRWITKIAKSARKRIASIQQFYEANDNSGLKKHCTSIHPHIIYVLAYLRRVGFERIKSREQWPFGVCSTPVLLSEKYVMKCGGIYVLLYYYLL